MNLFKKKISSEKIASGLYHSIINNNNKKATEDHEGNVILTKNEQDIMITQHLYKLLDSHNLIKAKLHILNIFTSDCYRVKHEEELYIYGALVLKKFKIINNYLKDISTEEDDIFLKKEFLFDKILNPVQKILAIKYYTDTCKEIDLIFETTIKKFRIVDK